MDEDKIEASEIALKRAGRALRGLQEKIIRERALLLEREEMMREREVNFEKRVVEHELSVQRQREEFEKESAALERQKLAENALKEAGLLLSSEKKQKTDRRKLKKLQRKVYFLEEEIRKQQHAGESLKAAGESARTALIAARKTALADAEYKTLLTHRVEVSERWASKLAKEVERLEMELKNRREEFNLLIRESHGLEIVENYVKDRKICRDESIQVDIDNMEIENQADGELLSQLIALKKAEATAVANESNAQKQLERLKHDLKVVNENALQTSKAKLDKKLVQEMLLSKEKEAVALADAEELRQKLKDLQQEVEAKAEKKAERVSAELVGELSREVIDAKEAEALAIADASNAQEELLVLRAELESVLLEKSREKNEKNNVVSERIESLQKELNDANQAKVRAIQETKELKNELELLRQSLRNRKGSTAAAMALAGAERRCWEMGEECKKKIAGALLFFLFRSLRRKRLHTSFFCWYQNCSSEVASAKLENARLRRDIEKVQKQMEKKIRRLKLEHEISVREMKAKYKIQTLAQSEEKKKITPEWNTRSQKTPPRSLPKRHLVKASPLRNASSIKGGPILYK
eukprot:g3341.t1